jgi:hypothetical protein
VAKKVARREKKVARRECGGGEGVARRGDDDGMPNDEMPDHAPANPPLSAPDMWRKWNSNVACPVWFWIHGLGVGDSHLPPFEGAIEPQMSFFGRNGCSDFLTSTEWSGPMRILGRRKIAIYWVDIINSLVQYFEIQLMTYGRLLVRRIASKIQLKKKRHTVHLDR